MGTHNIGKLSLWLVLNNYKNISIIYNLNAYHLEPSQIIEASEASSFILNLNKIDKPNLKTVLSEFPVTLL